MATLAHRRLHGFSSHWFLLLPSTGNKRCICIDGEVARRAAVAHDLLRNADVLIENFGPGTMDRIGLGWDGCACAQSTPRLHCALKGFLPGPL